MRVLRTHISQSSIRHPCECESSFSSEWSEWIKIRQTLFRVSSWLCNLGQVMGSLCALDPVSMRRGSWWFILDWDGDEEEPDASRSRYAIHTALFFFFALYLNTQSQVFKYQADVIWSRDDVWSFYVSTRCWHATIMQKLFMEWKTASSGVGLPAVMEQRRRAPRRHTASVSGQRAWRWGAWALTGQRQSHTGLCGWVTM